MDQVDEAKNLGDAVVDRQSAQGFTPGPWKVTPSGFFEGVCVRTEDNTWVAQVWSAHGGTELPRDANARLIAAAPALYNALAGLAFSHDARDAGDPCWCHIEDDNQSHFERTGTHDKWCSPARAAFAAVHSR